MRTAVSRTPTHHSTCARPCSIFVLIIGAVISLFPFYWMINTSLKPSYAIFTYPPIHVADRSVAERVRVCVEYDERTAFTLQ